jgi:hypothetical protein
MDQTLENIQNLAELFSNIESSNKDKRKEVELRLIDVVNKLNQDELKYFTNYFNEKKYIELINKYKNGILIKNDQGAVTILRYNLLQYLINGEKISSEIIDIEKDKIRNIVKKHNEKYDPFHSWKNDRVLYQFCYYLYKKDIIEYLNKITDEIRNKLNIFKDTKKNVVSFDGAQNQGFNHCWIAIYDNNFKSQQDTKQLYIGFHKNKILFGVHEHKIGNKKSEIKKEISYEIFSINEISSFFKDNINKIFEYRELEKKNVKIEKKLSKNKNYTPKERKLIIDKIYSENSSYESKVENIEKALHHGKIYNSIGKYLKDNYDKYYFEDNNIDIKTIKDNETYIFEIKPCNRSG